MTARRRSGRTTLPSILLAASVSACALGSGGTTHSPQEQAQIDQAQRALDAMGGLRARFVQAGPGSEVADGEAWFEVGHLRLQYDAPTQRLAVATLGRLVVHDQHTDATTRISLATNPLGLLLSGPIRLFGALDVTDVRESGDGLQLSLARRSNPAQGLLTLFFTRRPAGGLLLSGLEAVDAEQHRTRFHLLDQQVGQRFDPALFVLPQA